MNILLPNWLIRRALRQHGKNYVNVPGICGLLFLTLLSLATVSSSASSGTRPIRVLMLYFGDKNAIALEEFQVGVRRSMDRDLDTPVTIYTESLDEERVGRSPELALAMEQLLRRKYSESGIDVVVPIGQYPLEFIEARKDALFPNAKLLFIAPMQAPPKPIPHASGMVIPTDLGPTIELAIAENPGTRHVMLITGSSLVDRAFAHAAVDNSQKYLDRRHIAVDLQTLTPGTLPESLRKVASLPQDMVSVFVTYYGDSAGETFVPARILPRFSAASNRPIYGWAAPHLGRGIVGGSLIDMEENGALFGEMIVQVVGGIDPATVPVMTGDLAKNQFDWKQLKRWNIPVDKVPAGATVIGREFTFWELYKWQALGLIGLIFVETILILTLLRLAISERRHSENLAYRRKVETLIAQCAASFINLPGEFIDNEMEISFQDVLEFFDLDRINLMEFAEGNVKPHLLSIRGARNSSPPSPGFDLQRLTWASDQLMQGRRILVSTLKDLPSEASALLDYLKFHEIRSIAMFPLIRDKNLFGVLTFSTIRVERTWETDLVVALSTISDIFGNALERKNAEEAASVSRNRLTGIVDSAMDAIIAMDERHRIVVFNTTAEVMFRCTADEALGQSIDGFMPERFRALHRNHVGHFADGATTNRAMGGFNPIMALRRNGEEFPIEASISQVKVSGTSLFTVIIRDVTERQQTLQKLRDSNDLNVSILHSLKEHLAVLDFNGIVVATTARGPEFLAINGIKAEGVRIGDDYIAMCKAVARAGDKDVAVAVEGIQAVNDAKMNFFEMEYSYGSGIDKRWLLMTVTPLRMASRGVLISHEDITLRKRNEQAIRELSGRLINAQELERSRIARELHDDINQQIAMLAIELQQLKVSSSSGSPEANERIDTIWRKTHALSLDVQRLSHRLHSSKLDHLGIVGALRGLCNEVSDQIKIDIDFQSQQVPMFLEPDASLSIFRVAQESLHNIAKHAQAKKVQVELVGLNDMVVLRVSDDGVGFDMDAPEHKDGLGMVSMRERIRSVGGTISFFSKPSQGTQIETAIPVVNQPIAAAVIG